MTSQKQDGGDERLHGHNGRAGVFRAAGFVAEAHCSSERQCAATATQNARQIHLQLGGESGWLKLETECKRQIALLPSTMVIERQSR